jgi:hypothetical protein
MRDGLGITYSLHPFKAHFGFWKNNHKHGIGYTLNERILKLGLWEDGKLMRWFRDSHEGFNYILKNVNYSLFQPYIRHSASEGYSYINKLIQ